MLDFLDVFKKSTQNQLKVNIRLTCGMR